MLSGPIVINDSAVNDSGSKGQDAAARKGQKKVEGERRVSQHKYYRLYCRLLLLLLLLLSLGRVCSIIRSETMDGEESYPGPPLVLLGFEIKYFRVSSLPIGCPPSISLVEG